MAVEHQLRFLGYLPHPHRAVPPSCRDTQLAAQAVQSCDRVLMPEATADQNYSSNSKRSNSSGWQGNKERFARSLTEFPHTRSRPHSTPLPSDRERRCTGHKFPS